MDTALVFRGALAIVSLATPIAASAQAYPVKPVRTVMTLSGGANIIARIVADRMTQALGQPVVLDPILGAAGGIGTETVARAAPDGYTILLASSAQVVTRVFLVKDVTYDPVKSFSPIGRVAEAVSVVAVHPSLPVNSLRELIDHAKSSPKKIFYGTSGVGTQHHLSAEMIRQLTGIEWVHVPYKGGSPSVQALMGGQIPVAFSILATLVQAVETGKVRVIAVNADSRYRVIPDVPTVAEQVPGYERPPAWMAYLGPAGMPAPIVSRLNAEIVRTMADPEIAVKSEAIGFVPNTSSPEQLGQMIRQNVAITARLMKSVGIQPK